MSIQFTCPSCPQTFKVPDMLAGRRAQCTACATRFLVPTPLIAVAGGALPNSTAEGSSAAGSGGEGGLISLGRPINWVAVFGAVALIACIFLPWIAVGDAEPSLLALPSSESAVSPIGFAMSDSILGRLGVMALQPLPALARFGFLLIPIMGLVVLIRELATFSQNRAPRMAYLAGAVAPLIAVVLVGMGLGSADLVRLDDSADTMAAAFDDKMAHQSGEDTGDTDTNDSGGTDDRASAGLTAHLTVGMAVALERASLGLSVAVVGMLGCLLAPLTVRRPRPRPPIEMLATERTEMFRASDYPVPTTPEPAPSTALPPTAAPAAPTAAPAAPTAAPAAPSVAHHTEAATAAAPAPVAAAATPTAAVAVSGSSGDGGALLDRVAEMVESADSAEAVVAAHERAARPTEELIAYGHTPPTETPAVSTAPPTSTPAPPAAPPPAPTPAPTPAAASAAASASGSTESEPTMPVEATELMAVGEATDQAIRDALATRTSTADAVAMVVESAADISADTSNDADTTTSSSTSSDATPSEAISTEATGPNSAEGSAEKS